LDHVIVGYLFHCEISSLIDPLALPRNENSRGMANGSIAIVYD
jgi:hypothetical protein